MTGPVELTENSKIRLASHACPSCKAQGCLKITKYLRATPWGSYSLAGYQDKFLVTEYPVIFCVACAWRLEGEFTMDGHVEFPAPEGAK